jgi:two-component SAPR family response regulator
MTEEELKALVAELAALRDASEAQLKRTEMARDRAKELAVFARNLKLSLMGETLP